MSRLLIAFLLAVAACSGRGTEASPVNERTSATAPEATVSSTTVPETTTTAAPTRTPDPNAPASPATLIHERYRDTVEFGDGLEADVFAPDDVGDHPVAVLVHGGGWVAGDKSSMWLLADGLAARGLVAYAIDYRTISRGGRFPVTVDDVACGVRLAHRDAGRFTTTPDRVVLIGHSAGAHLSALVAFGGEAFGGSCPDDGDQTVTGFVGLAGPYDIDRLAVVLAPFFGSRLDDDPEPWRRGNPFTYVAAGLGVPSLLIHGEDDQVVPAAFSEELAGALEDAGVPVVLELVPGAGHGTVIDPRVVGDLVARWVAELG